MKVTRASYLLLMCLLCQKTSEASLIGSLMSRNDISSAISADDYDKAASILNRKSCDILLKNNHEALTILSSKYYSSGGHVYDLIRKSCGMMPGTFIVDAVKSALLHDDAEVLEMLLSIVQVSQSLHLTGSIFERCVLARNIQCLETLYDWGIYLSHEGKNILHFAAELNDLKLMKCVPDNQLILDKADGFSRFPMQSVYSEELAQALAKRWEFETKFRVPSWRCTTTMYSLLKEYNIPDVTVMQRASKFTEIMPKLANPGYKISIRPGHILEDSFEFSKAVGPRWYAPSLNVQIQVSTGDGLITELSKVEWLTELMHILFDEGQAGSTAADYTAPFFEQVDIDSQMYAPTGLYPNEVYKFAGSIIALALRERIGLNVKLAPAVVKKLLLQNYAYEAKDFEAQHPALYEKARTLQVIDFEGFNKIYQEITGMPCRDSLEECSNDIGQAVCYFKYDKVLTQLSNGFKAIHQESQLPKYFSVTEISNILEGGGVVIKAEDFLMNCQIVSQTSQPKQNFTEMINGMDETELFFFYQFITSRASIPYEGLRGLPQKFKIQMDILPEGSLPVASSGSSSIAFPKGINSSEELKEKLFSAINQQFEVV